MAFFTLCIDNITQYAVYWNGGDTMPGIDLDRPIRYLAASLRFFKEGEHHIARRCPDDVLLLVYDGVLRFTEDGVPYEIGAGQYHIQRQNSLQTGEQASDVPKYLYVHFRADAWTDSGKALPRSGTFDHAAFLPLMEELHRLAHSDAAYITQAGRFYDLLSALYRQKPGNALADRMADFIAGHCDEEVTLEMLCREFHFSRNHIIHLFREAFGMTPIAYAQHRRLQKAELLIEMTSETLESIAAACGFRNYSHFYRLFVRKNRLSPEKWRESKRLGRPTG